MNNSAPTTSYTWEEYLQLDEESLLMCEFFDGEIFEKGHETNRHNEIIGNSLLRLRSVVRKNGGKFFSIEVKLFRYQSEKYLYPDAMATCNPLDLQAHNGIRSPFIIFEVLSKSTRNKDRGFKLREYTKLPSLQHYLLIEQTHCEVQHFRRREDQTWEMLFYEEMDQKIPIPELDLTLVVSEFYEGVEFGPEVDRVEEEEGEYEKTN